MKVLVIGASNNPDRYSYKAVEMLIEYKHQPIPFSQKKAEVCGLTIENEWRNWQDIHTVTLYVNPKLQEAYYDLILGLKPQRVIFNPGTKNDEFESMLKKNGIEAIEACTLVMLRTNQF